MVLIVQKQINIVWRVAIIVFINQYSLCYFSASRTCDRGYQVVKNKMAAPMVIKLHV